MSEISIIGLDLAKQVFQVHGADQAGRCVLRNQLKRREVLGFFAGLAPCIVAMEACGSAHYWARAIAKLGHAVRLVPPAYAKPTRSAARPTGSMRRQFARPRAGPRCALCR